jgi:hypothetical protein
VHAGAEASATNLLPAALMLHVATVHHGSPRWIEIQTAHVREHVSAAHRIWTSLEGIDPSYGAHFDHVVEQKGMHAAKLNHLAIEISHEASDDDLIMFLDGDSFPIADPMPLINDGLAQAPLLAVRRAENADEPQPHPCFCVTSVRTWRTLPGDWSAGYTWPGARGRATSDVGANLLRQLELSGTPWKQVLRSNRRNLDPLFFAIYGDAVYHHGAGLTGGLCPAHRASSPQPLPVPRAPGLASALRLANRLRWRRWERGLERRLTRESELFYEKIRGGGSDWLAELM